MANNVTVDDVSQILVSDEPISRLSSHARAFLAAIIAASMTFGIALEWKLIAVVVRQHLNKILLILNTIFKYCSERRTGS